MSSAARRFFCFLNSKSEGPFDLIELAAQLKYLSIDGETLVCREGEDSWTDSAISLNLP